MILQALERYAKRRDVSGDALAPDGYESKEIPFIVQIDLDGKFVQVLDTRTKANVRGARYLVPQAIKRSVNIEANLLWDQVEYALGLAVKSDAGRVRAAHAAFITKLAALPTSILSIPEFKALTGFLASDEQKNLVRSSPQWDDLTKNPFVSFGIAGAEVALLCLMDEVGNYLSQGREPADGICLISGEAEAIARLHPSIKGVWGAQSSGASIVSFNTEAYNSYGKAQGNNAPIGARAAANYAKALSSLLQSDSKQRLQLGDSSTVFWAAEPHPLEESLTYFLREPSKDDDPDIGIKAVKAAVQSASSGIFALGDANTEFHFLGLAPNAARISVRFWRKETALELARHLATHYQQLDIVRPAFEAFPYPSPQRILRSIALLGKSENIPPNLSGELMRAILTGTPYPATLLGAAVRRSKAEQEVIWPRAAIIKAILNRNANHEEFHVALDLDNMHAAYRLGRLFATLEKVQEEASPGLNATIRDRYYGAASASPVSVFTTLLRLKNHHLAKLDNPGRRVNLERLLGEIMNGIAEFPRQLNLPDQGRFALGYYHQRQDFFTKKAD